VKNHGSEIVTPGTFGLGYNRRNKRSSYFVLKKVYAINDYFCCGFTFYILYRLYRCIGQYDDTEQQFAILSGIQRQ